MKRQQQRKTTAFDLPSRIEDWGYGQHGSWSGCSKYIWTRAERFTDWAHEFLLGPVDEGVIRGSIAARVQLRNHRQQSNKHSIGSYVGKSR